MWRPAAPPQLLTTAYWAFTALMLGTSRAPSLWLRRSALKCVSAPAGTQTPLPEQRLCTHRKSVCHTRPSAHTLSLALPASLASHLASPPRHALTTTQQLCPQPRVFSLSFLPSSSLCVVSASCVPFRSPFHGSWAIHRPIRFPRLHLPWRGTSALITHSPGSPLNVSRWAWTGCRPYIWGLASLAHLP